MVTLNPITDWRSKPRRSPPDQRSARSGISADATETAMSAYGSWKN